MKKALLASLVLTSCVVNAEDRWFEVELLAFARPDGQFTEQFSPDITPISVNQAVDLLTSFYYPAPLALPECDVPVNYDIEGLPINSVLSEQGQLQSTPCQVAIDSGPDAQNPGADVNATTDTTKEQGLPAQVAANANPEWLRSEPTGPDSAATTVVQANLQPQLPPPLLRAPLVIDGPRWQDGEAPTAEGFLLTAESLQFTEIRKKLAQKHLTPVLHMAWRQLVTSSRKAKDYRIFGGENFTEHYFYDGTIKPLATEPLATDTPTLIDSENKVLSSQTNSANPMDATRDSAIDANEQLMAALLNEHTKQVNGQKAQDSDTEVTTSDTETTAAEINQSARAVAEQQFALAHPNWPNETWQLDGLFRLHVEHYLYINAQFNYRELQQQNLQPYYGKFFRRVISGELHYFDHPKFGLIVQIRKIQ